MRTPTSKTEARLELQRICKDIEWNLQKAIEAPEGSLLQSSHLKSAERLEVQKTQMREFV